MALTNADVDAAIPVAGTPSRSLTNAAVKQLIVDKAAYNAPATIAGTTATLVAGTHDNRDNFCTNASAVTLTFDNTNAMAVGASFSVYQNAAGLVSIVAGTGGTLELSPGVVTAATVSVRGWLDCLVVATNTLRVVARGEPREIIIDMANSAAVGASQTNATLATATIPANTFVAGKMMMIDALCDITTNNNATFSITYGGTQIAVTASSYNTFGAAFSFILKAVIASTGTSAQQSQELTNIGAGYGAIATGAFTKITSAVDSSVAQTLLLRVTTGAGTTSVTSIVSKVRIF